MSKFVFVEKMNGRSTRNPESRCNEHHKVTRAQDANKAE